MTITSFQFARRLRDELRDGLISSVDRTFRPYYSVTGRIDVGAVLASVEIRVWQDYWLLRRRPPLVFCKEHWMRNDDDWHNNHITGMCWVLQDVWCDAMNWEGKRAVAVIEEGHRWLVNDVACLINRHYTGFLEKLAAWPKEWPYWEHYDKGAKDYERQKRLRLKSRRVI